MCLKHVISHKSPTVLMLDLAKGQFGSTRIGSQLIAALMYGLQDAIDKPIVRLDKGVSFLH
jgi:hypothetical protein